MANNQTINYKSIAATILRNKNEINNLLQYFLPQDIEKGIIAISEKLINKELKPFIIEKAYEYLSDYSVQFSSDTIFLNCKLDIQQLGPITANYKLKVTAMEFTKETPFLAFSYNEDIKSNGNIVQGMALKAASLKDHFIKTALEIIKTPLATADKTHIYVNLSSLGFIEKLPSHAKLTYISSDNGILKLYLAI